MVQSVLDLAKLAEQIVLFAQLVSGAYLRMGEQDFAVICSYEVLSDTTDRFSHFDLLAQVYGGTPYRLAVGIGTGLHFQQALANAELGTQRAWEEGSNRAYLVYAEDRFVGPIQPNELMHVKRSQFDPQLLKVAQDCALSNNTVLKISTFVQRKITARSLPRSWPRSCTSASAQPRASWKSWSRTAISSRSAAAFSMVEAGRPASFSCCAEFHAENQFQRYDPTQCVLPQCCRTAAAIRRGKVWILPVCPDGFTEWMRERRRGSLSYPPRRSSCFHLIQWSCFQQPRPLPRGPFAPAYFSVPCGATFAPSSARLIFQRNCAG